MFKSTLLSALVAIPLLGTAQIDPTPFLRGAQSDINYLAGEYLKPAGKALATGINNGWYNSAKTHKPLRFEVSFSTGLVNIPNEDRSFIIDESRLDQLELVNPANNEAPTAFGANSNGPALRLKSNSNTEFNTPSGTGFHYFPQLGLNAEVGVGLHSDVLIRFFPNSSIPGLDNSEFNMFGFGINHSFLHWLPAGDKLPIDASILVAYSKMNYHQPLETNIDGENQHMEFNASGYTARVLVSKELLFLTVYGGAGINKGTSDVFINGTYTYDDGNGNQISVQDPLKTTTDANGVVGNLGLKLDFLWVVNFSADYTFGSYEALTLGLGVDIDL